MIRCVQAICVPPRNNGIGESEDMADSSDQDENPSYGGGYNTGAVAGTGSRTGANSQTEEFFINLANNGPIEIQNYLSGLNRHEGIALYYRIDSFLTDHNFSSEAENWAKGQNE
ncbi:hypothetical protein JIP32914_10147 [Tenacibaculum maritimum]|uniref:hypothetical protein n=1 Tax=Tenacibaculum maritimum TaxID=107401 RepID=UPI0012E50A1E|nr:hypothetical protein [Tenacibaculum maritimum]CAA0151223.1 hypothetical protein JIP32914_10147 [Tenacibaculum maritimum]